MRNWMVLLCCWCSRRTCEIGFENQNLRFILTGSTILYHDTTSFARSFSETALWRGTVGPRQLQIVPKYRTPPQSSLKHFQKYLRLQHWWLYWLACRVRYRSALNFCFSVLIKLVEYKLRILTCTYIQMGGWYKSEIPFLALAYKQNNWNIATSAEHMQRITRCRDFMDYFSKIYGDDGA
jgi:hypothetical protein